MQETRNSAIAAWEQQLQQLRQEYLRTSAERIQTLTRLLDELGRHPADTAALGDLVRVFHGLAGSGSTYGFPQVTTIGGRLEEEADRLLATERQPTREQLRSWRLEVQQMAHLLSRGPAAGYQQQPAAANITPERTDHDSYDVLIVEDDTIFGRALQMLLQQNGMTVRWVRTRNEAEATVRTRACDGIIVDVLLPDGSGYELVEWLRQQEGGDEAVIIVVSVLSSFVDKVEAVHCGADSFFSKPVNWDALLRRLTRLLEKRRTPAWRILSVEDDPADAQLISSVLEAAGYEVRICDDPAHFEADLAAFQPDLVLMDVVLPGISGFDLVRYMRQVETHITMPVLFMTAMSEHQHRINALKAGGDDFLVKPVNPGLLLTMVATHIEKARIFKSMVDRDGLTGLLNHTAFWEQARTVFAKKNRRRGKPSALVMIDVDQFKPINDRFGHPTGDAVLRELASLLRRRLRLSDIVGRYGGEEFALVVEELTEDEVVRLVSRLKQEFASIKHQAGDGTHFEVTFSAGVAMLDANTPDIETWRDEADRALYAAKAAGRNRVELASRPELGT